MDSIKFFESLHNEFKRIHATNNFPLRKFKMAGFNSVEIQYLMNRPEKGITSDRTKWKKKNS